MLSFQTYDNAIHYEYNRLLYRVAESPSEVLDFTYYHKVAAGLIQGDVDSVFINRDDPQIDSGDCNGLTPLHWAAICANEPALKALLRARVNVMARNSTGITALHMASISGHLRCIELLLIAGADILARDSLGWQPLHFASQFRSTKEVIETLLMAGADVYGRNNNRACAFQIVCAFGNADTALALLLAGACIDDQDNEGDTALLETIYTGSVQTIELLLSNGAGLQYYNSHGHTVLHILVLYGTLETITPFMSHQLGSLDVERKNVDELTAWELLQIVQRHRKVL